jgi:hypothetical protein
VPPFSFAQSRNASIRGSPEINHPSVAPRSRATKLASDPQGLIGAVTPELVNPVQQPEMIMESRLSWHFDYVWGGSAVQTPSSRKRILISRIVSDLTGKVQSAGVEKQPAVEHLRRNARRPLVPPTTSIWFPEITFLQMVQ